MVYPSIETSFHPWRVLLTCHAIQALDCANAGFWFAGKCLEPHRLLSHYLGANEKSKATMVLQSKDDPRPIREKVCCAALIPWLISYIGGSLSGYWTCNFVLKTQGIKIELSTDARWVPTLLWAWILQAVDEADLLAWQFKRQQTQAALEADTDDFTTSRWADPHLMKHELSGLGSIRWR